MARGDLTVKFLADISQIRRATDEINGRLGGLAGVARKVGVALGSAFAVREVIDFGRQLVSAAEESQKVARQTEAVLRSTGGAANVTAQDVSRLADALSRKAGIDDEVIQSGENVLLTFTKIRNEAGAGNDIFNQATRLALDMSVALGTDMQSAVLQLGKALNDPLTGLTALRRAGVSFTAEQQEQIKALVRSGDLLGAQKLILAELRTEFEGSAEAQATGTAKLQVAWENLKETLGAKLLPVVENVTASLAEKLPGALDRLGDLGRSVGERLRSMFSGADADSAVGGFVGKIREAFGRIDLSQLTEVFTHIRNVVTTIWSAIGDDILRIVRAGFDTVISVVKAALDVLAGIIRFVLAVMNGDWGAAWDAIKQVLGGVWDAMFAIVRGGVEVVRGVIGAALSSWQALWSLAWDAIGGIVRGAWGVITWIVSAGVEAVKGLWGGITTAWETVWNTVKDTLSRVWETMKSIVAKAIDFIKREIDRILGPLDDVIAKIGRVAGAVGGFVGGAIGKVKGAFAGGVTNFEGGLAIVGEAGPELVRLPRGSDVIPLQRLAAAPAATVVHVHVQALDPRGAADAVVQAIDAWERRNGRLFARV